MENDKSEILWNFSDLSEYGVFAKMFEETKIFDIYMLEIFELNRCLAFSLN